MFDSYGDGELISMATDAPYDREIRAELWDRADMDVSYGRGSALGMELERRGIKRLPVVGVMSRTEKGKFGGSLTDRYRKRWGK